MFPLDSFLEKANQLNHSKKYKEAVEVYVNKLNRNGLPIIFSRKHLCELFGISYYHLSSIIKDNHSPQVEEIGNYDYFLLKKKNGKYRRITASRDILKQIQLWINAYILSQVKLSEHCTGFVKGKSILDNAKPHLNKKYLLNIDIKDFFPTITEKRVFGMFKNLGYHENLAVDLAKLTTTCTNGDFITHVIDKFFASFDLGDKFAEERLIDDTQRGEKSIKIYPSYLPQGAPTSPLITNIICRKLDLRLSNLAKSKNGVYTRYADDMTFSGNYGQIPSINLIRYILKDEGFVMNEGKTKFISPGGKKYVTGLDVSGTKVRVPKKFRDKISKHIFFCKKYGVKNHLLKIKNTKKHFDEWLWGCICFVHSVEEDYGKKLMREYNEIGWEDYRGL